MKIINRRTRERVKCRKLQLCEHNMHIDNISMHISRLYTSFTLYYCLRLLFYSFLQILFLLSSFSLFFSCLFCYFFLFFLSPLFFFFFFFNNPPPPEFSPFPLPAPLPI